MEWLWDVELPLEVYDGRRWPVLAVELLLDEGQQRTKSRIHVLFRVPESLHFAATLCAPASATSTPSGLHGWGRTSLRSLGPSGDWLHPTVLFGG